MNVQISFARKTTHALGRSGEQANLRLSIPNPQDNQKTSRYGNNPLLKARISGIDHESCKQATTSTFRHKQAKEQRELSIRGLTLFSLNFEFTSPPRQCSCIKQALPVPLNRIARLVRLKPSSDYSRRCRSLNLRRPATLSYQWDLFVITRRKDRKKEGSASYA